jgi:hypothetical protein
MQLILKYLVTVVVPAAIQLFGSKYLGQEGAAGLAVAVGAGGARVLHTTEAPKK